MKKKQKIGILICMILLLFQWNDAKPVLAAEKKEVLINQINTIDSETLTYTATTGGRLEIIVPLDYATQNEDWSVKLESNKYSKSREYSSYDVMEDKTVLVAYIPAGEYKLSFRGKAICQINFIVDTIHDEIENNDSVDTANPLYVNTDKRGEIRIHYNYEDEDYFKVTITETGLLQVETIAGEYMGYIYSIYKEEENGNISELFKNYVYDEYAGEKAKSPRFFVTPGNYYVRIKAYDGYDGLYTLRANFTSTANAFHEIENNDVYTSATEITTNIDYSGNLEDTEDIDYYHVSLAQPQLAEIALKTIRQEEDGIFYVTLYQLGSNGLEEILSFSSSTNNVLHQGDSRYLEAGDYYIKVKTGNGSIYTIPLSEQDYQVQFTAKTIALSQPQISLQQGSTSSIKITADEFGEFVTGMEVYEKVGNGEWTLVGTQYGEQFYQDVPKLGVDCIYKVRTFYQDEESGAIVYSSYSNEASVNIPELKQPSVSAKRTDFNKITLSFKNIDTRAKKIIISQKVGKGSWEEIKTIASSRSDYTLKIQEIGKQYSYRICTTLDDFDSEFSEVKSLTIPATLPKPTFTATKKKYYGTLAFYIKPTKCEYAQGVEIWAGVGKNDWDMKGKLNLSKAKGTYLYNLQKRAYYIKMRSYRTFNGKKIYSPWTAVKKFVR